MRFFTSWAPRRPLGAVPPTASSGPARPARCRPSVLAAGLGLWLTGCVQLTYDHVERFQPPAAEAVAGLQVGQGLDRCMELLGAPWQVLEREQDPGLILVYAWERGSGWGLSLSGAGDDSVPGSLNLANSRSLPRALTLWFDGQDRLLRYEQGFLSPSLAAALRNLQAFSPGGGR